MPHRCMSSSPSLIIVCPHHHALSLYVLITIYSGDLLLEAMKEECRSKNDTHMLLVHDDNGSGKLIDYYVKRGFKDVDSILKGAMIVKL
jgi:hypothetical protein